MPSSIIRLEPQSGTQNMGDVSDETDRVARFIIPEDDLVLLYIRGRFTGGTGTANLVLKLDRQATKSIIKRDTTLFTFLSVGSTLQVHARFTEDEREAWSFLQGDELVFEWTNPDPGNLEWYLEVGLKRIHAIDQS